MDHITNKDFYEMSRPVVVLSFNFVGTPSKWSHSAYRIFHINSF
jgi:hypothetical protein